MSAARRRRRGGGTIAGFLLRSGIHIASAALIAFLLMAPDFAAQKFMLKIPLIFSTKYFLIFMAFAAVLLLVRSKRIILLFLLFLLVLQITQFMNMAYFSDYLSPLGLDLMWIESADVTDVVLHEAVRLSYAPALVIVSFGLIYWVVVKLHPYRVTVPYLAPLLTFLFIAAVPARVYSMQDPIRFFPSPATPSLMNTLNAYSVYGVGVLKGNRAAERKHFIPYRAVERVPSGAATSA